MANSNLQNLVNGLLGTFVSRNNDIRGYWGLGVLRALADASRREQIEIDLLGPEVEYDAIRFVARKYRSWLKNSVGKTGPDLDALSIARIRVRFENSFEQFPNLVKDTRGLPYECTVELRKGAEKLYVASKAGVCAPHDSSKDIKSTRESE